MTPLSPHTLSSAQIWRENFDKSFAEAIHSFLSHCTTESVAVVVHASHVTQKQVHQDKCLTYTESQCTVELGDWGHPSYPLFLSDILISRFGVAGACYCVI